MDMPLSEQQPRTVRRGEIYFAQMSHDALGSEVRGLRPVLILQNNTGNFHGPTTIVAALTSRIEKAKLPTHVIIQHNGRESLILLEQIRTIDKRRLFECIGHLNTEQMAQVNEAIQVSLGLKIPTHLEKGDDNIA